MATTQKRQRPPWGATISQQPQLLHHQIPGPSMMMTTMGGSYAVPAAPAFYARQVMATLPLTHSSFVPAGGAAWGGPFVFASCPYCRAPIGVACPHKQGGNSCMATSTGGAGMAPVSGSKRAAVWPAGGAGLQQRPVFVPPPPLEPPDLTTQPRISAGPATGLAGRREHRYLLAYRYCLAGLVPLECNSELAAAFWKEEERPAANAALPLAKWTGGDNGGGNDGRRNGDGGGGVDGDGDLAGLARDAVMAGLARAAAALGALCLGYNGASNDHVCLMLDANRHSQRAMSLLLAMPGRQAPAEVAPAAVADGAGFYGSGGDGGDSGISGGGGGGGGGSSGGIGSSRDMAGGGLGGVLGGGRDGFGFGRGAGGTALPFSGLLSLAIGGAVVASSGAAKPKKGGAGKGSAGEESEARDAAAAGGNAAFETHALLCVYRVMEALYYNMTGDNAEYVETTREAVEVYLALAPTFRLETRRRLMPVLHHVLLNTNFRTNSGPQPDRESLSRGRSLAATWRTMRLAENGVSADGIKVNGGSGSSSDGSASDGCGSSSGGSSGGGSRTDRSCGAGSRGSGGGGSSGGKSGGNAGPGGFFSSKYPLAEDLLELNNWICIQRNMCGSYETRVMTDGEVLQLKELCDFAFLASMRRLRDLGTGSAVVSIIHNILCIITMALPYDPALVAELISTTNAAMAVLQDTPGVWLVLQTAPFYADLCRVTENRMAYDLMAVNWQACQKVAQDRLPTLPPYQNQQSKGGRATAAHQSGNPNADRVHEYFALFRNRAPTPS